MPETTKAEREAAIRGWTRRSRVKVGDVSATGKAHADEFRNLRESAEKNSSLHKKPNLIERISAFLTGRS